MTVGVCVKCSDGLVLACDSLETFGRGVPVLKYSNKVHELNHERLAYPVAVEAAGMTTFFNKFCDAVLRDSIGEAAASNDETLDIVDFCETVCEPTVLAMFRRYVFDRAKFLQAPPTADLFSLSLIVAGATRDKETRAYFVYSDGLTEAIDSYGTIGSGAAYAELFLRFLLPRDTPTVEEASRVAVYAIKGVELMDPHVGRDVNLMTLAMKADELSVTTASSDGNEAKDEMEKVLRSLTESIGGFVGNKELVTFREGEPDDHSGIALEEREHAAAPQATGN